MAGAVEEQFSLALSRADAGDIGGIGKCAHRFLGRRLMNWIAPTVLVLQILLLLYVMAIDIATRVIHNEICWTLALLGIASQFAGPAHIVESLIAATILFLLLLVVYQRGWIGGGDVKLVVALTVGLPLTGLVQLLTVTSLAGAVLALTHLTMRSLPAPRPAPAGSALLCRVYAVERWRHVRRAPLPFGAAIACGGIWSLLSQGL
jgi:prepilin peptidase CpaA